MTGLDAFALGAGIGLAAVLVYDAITSPPTAAESWCWRRLAAHT